MIFCFQSLNLKYTVHFATLQTNRSKLMNSFEKSQLQQPVPQIEQRIRPVAQMQAIVHPFTVMLPIHFAIMSAWMSIRTINAQRIDVNELPSVALCLASQHAIFARHAVPVVLGGLEFVHFHEPLRASSQRPTRQSTCASRTRYERQAIVDALGAFS